MVLLSSVETTESVSSRGTTSIQYNLIALRERDWLLLPTKRINMERIQICPRGCQVTDKGKDICPRCGAIMKHYASRDTESVMSDMRAMQKEKVHDTLNGRYVEHYRI